MTTGTRVPGARFAPGTYQCRRCGRLAQCNISRSKPLTCLACTHPAEAEAGFPDQGWAVQALCAQVDPEVWFPAKGSVNKAAKAVCAKCPVRAECLSYALATGQPFGVWGGLSAAERRRLVVV